MKFSDFSASGWEENRQYYDTCLLPFTGLQGTESPPETAAALERLRDFLDIAEKPFQGRIVTYPALQYAGAESTAFLNAICQKVKSSGFQYAIVLTADVSFMDQEIIESDLLLSLPDIYASQEEGIAPFVRGEIQAIWQK